MRTSQSQVVYGIILHVLFGLNVLDVKRQKRGRVLWLPACNTHIDSLHGFAQAFELQLPWRVSKTG